MIRKAAAIKLTNVFVFHERRLHSLHKILSEWSECNWSKVSFCILL